MNTKRFKARYISDECPAFMEKGKVYDVYYPLDDKAHRFLAFTLEDMDEPGDYALPANRFEILT